MSDPTKFCNDLDKRVEEVKRSAVSIQEKSEELWDKYSQYVDDNIFSLEQVAGTVILTRGQYNDLIKELLAFSN